jgi:UDP-N-acetylglucosamine:LPS N-acetylglucosamine transferase
LLRAFGEARELVSRHEPNVVVALGGYASVPAGVAALLRRIPVVVAEQNAVPGLANRVIGRFARACAVSFDGTDLPRAVWTGNPVRPEILAVAGGLDRSAARGALGLPSERRLVVVFGGSLGARRINDALVSALPSLSRRGDLAIRHVIGRRDHAELTARLPPIEGELLYEPVEYEDDMATVLAAADLVVCRSGATTCAELAVIGRAAVLVPLPGAPGDHQTANARALETVGGAELIPDALLDAPLLVATLDRLLAEPELLDEMGQAATAIARPDAAAAVVDLVELHGGSGG